MLGARSMIKLRLLGLAALFCLFVGPPVHAAPVSYNVGVCDPGSTTHCIRPNADGSLNTTGTATEAPTTKVSTAALAASLVVRNATSTLLGFDVGADSTLSGAAWWVMIFDATSAPGDGAVTPAKCYAAPAGATSLSGGFTAPASFSTGITIAVSTTGCFTKTASTHAFISGDYR